MPDQGIKKNVPVDEPSTTAEKRPSKKHPDLSKPAADKPVPQALTKEEQLALYEEDLKENDWGHQPC